MRKILLVVLVLGATVCYGAEALQSYPISGMDGKVVLDANSGAYLFEFNEAIDDAGAKIDKGDRLELLKCNTLADIDKIVRDSNGVNNDFRIWAKVTKYQGKNYVYLSYYLPLSKPADVKDSNDADGGAMDDANKPSLRVLPDDVLEKLKPRRIVNTVQLAKALASDKDAVLVNRSGFVEYDAKADEYIFRLDSLGRKIQDVSFVLLKTSELEKVHKLKRKSLNPVRFKVAGVITSYQGKHYMLLQRVTRAYYNDNFVR